ncbi:O-antigen ligase family protein [Gloeocapsopsis crepidinum LEGE 06123]|uniref:O-antigen ligase family protein n=1 Tax=Gloeocapsopsis crepidinum LEGE 06123 TaxID=588587 RepID=A0ABR9UWC0_9CHRO|nr:O-antigen ligase [Gloeocapsopsis crepidinum]MBE9192592.1 O-antigen ligase family protein [Gloeocapsopsis crepidinum LEGE 06123]
MKNFLKLAENSFTVIALILFTGGVLGVLLRPDGASAEGSALFQIIWFVVYAITAGLLLIRLKGFTKIPTNLNLDIALLLSIVAIGIALFSYYWSVVPSVTLRRSFALLGTSIFGVYFSVRYQPREQLRLLGWAFGLMVVLSFVFAIAIPRYGIDVFPHAGAWRGVFAQKNNLGRAMTLSTLVFLLLALDKTKYRWMAWSGFILSFALLILSTSKTSLLVCVTTLALLPLYAALRWRSTVFLPIFIISILVASAASILVVSEADTLLSLIGKDATLTGRTPLWEAVWVMILQRPWLGYGYNAFWLGWQSYSSFVWEFVRWTPPHGHNGILDLWLDLGFLGVAVFTMSLLFAFLKAIRNIRQNKRPEFLFPIMYLTVLLLFNVTYSTILSRNDIYWVLYIAVLLWKPLQQPVKELVDKSYKQTYPLKGY